MLKFLGSSSLMGVLMVIYVIALGAATFVEHSYSTQVAMQTVYKAWWMFALQGILVVNFVAMSLRFNLFKKRRWGVLLLHYGFVCILMGAMTTYLTGVEGIMHIREGQSSRSVMDMQGVRQVATLPFDVSLEDFSIERYGHSGSPSSFASRLIVEGREHTVSMNNVLYHGAWRFYQTSYDTDEMGTFLTASRDVVGVSITYLGYAMLCVGLVMVLFDRRSRFRRLVATLGVLAIGVQSISADEVSAKFERLMVQNPSGRVEAMGSYASEVLRKLIREDSYRGLSASEVLIGITTNPNVWAKEKILKNEKGERIAFVDVLAPAGGYKLADKVEAIYKKPPRERTKEDKEILKLDERVNILDNLLAGRMLAIFPLDGSQKWYSRADDLSVFAPHGKDSLFAAKIYDWFANELAMGNRAKAIEILGMIETFQKAKASENLSSKVEAELLYNKLNIFKWSGFLYMGCGLLLSILIVVFGTDGRAIRYIVGALIIASIETFLYQSFGMGLRWWISGRAPWTNAYESMIYVGWATALSGIVFLNRSKITFSLAVFMAGALLFVSTLSWMDPQITPLAPVLDSYWLILHVAVITASYGFFGVSFLLGVVSAIMMATGRRALQSKIKELTTVNSLSMTLGLLLMTIGTFLGAVWANESWGRYWGWDPKETWALVTVLVYAFVVHMPMIKSFRGEFATTVGSIVALGSVLMTFFGVNYFLSGMHSYGADSAPAGLQLIYWIYGALAILCAYVWFKRRTN